MKSFEESYFARIVSLKRHIVRDQDKNEFLENVYHHEEERVIGLGKEYERLHMEEEESDQNVDTENVSAKIKERILKKNREEWLKKPRHGYLCNNIRENFNKVLTKLANDKPGRDQLAGVWIKRLTSVKGYLKGNLMTMFETDTEPSEELLTSKTILLARNSETGNPMNYRPIALQNTMYKIYTAILTEFIMDHCQQNEIITIEQAAGKRGSWGCTDQLLINKMVYEEVKTNRRNLATAWLDYKKAFDSVSHTWLIKSLELAKIPTKIIDAIKRLMNKWRTKVYLYGEKVELETGFIEYLRGILQGDTLSLILFVLTVNPLSYLLHMEEGYLLGSNEERQNFTHLFFVDDLKLYASTVTKLRRLLGIVTQFSNDVAMQFGVTKCAFQLITWGRREASNAPLIVKNLTLQEIEEGDRYKYLGMDESVGINGNLNKTKAIKEYKTRFR